LTLQPLWRNSVPSLDRWSVPSGRRRRARPSKSHLRWRARTNSERGTSEAVLARGWFCGTGFGAPALQPPGRRARV